jgi:hypothetical protein
MSDDFDDDLDDGENPDESSVIRNLRKQVRENADAAKRADAAERKLAFIEAGVPATKATEYFIRGYDGELTPEAIKAAAVEAGFVQAEEEETDPERDAEAAAHARLNDAENGRHDTAPPGYDDELAAAKTPDEVLAVVQKYGGKVTNA